MMLAALGSTMVFWLLLCSYRIISAVVISAGRVNEHHDMCKVVRAGINADESDWAVTPTGSESFHSYCYYYQ